MEHTSQKYHAAVADITNAEKSLDQQDIGCT